LRHTALLFIYRIINLII